MRGSRGKTAVAHLDGVNGIHDSVFLAIASAHHVLPPRSSLHIYRNASEGASDHILSQCEVGRQRLVTEDTVSVRNIPPSSTKGWTRSRS